MQKYSYRFILAFVLGISILLGKIDVLSASLKNEDLYAKSCALMDGESGRILFGKNENSPMANASTTKILTCIICLENANLEDVVTVSSEAAAQPKVHLGMKKGDQFLVRDLIYAMMLESYNDCAYALAEYVGNTVDSFSEMMNQKAREIGCKNTFFITPNGLDATTENDFHHSCAVDLCKIMKYCCWDSLKSDVFIEITNTSTYDFKDANGKNYFVSNKNAFLNIMDEAISGKTGFTSKAGYCYVAALESNGRKYVVALLACGWPNHKNYKWKDTKILFQTGMEDYKEEHILLPKINQKIMVKGTRPENASLNEWNKICYADVRYDKSITNLTLLLSKEDQISFVLDIPDKIYYSLNKEDMVGKVRCMVNGEIMCEYSLISGNTYLQWNFYDFFCCFVKSFLL